MAHNISITDDNLYNQISKYCKENGLKLNVFCTNLLKSSFRTEQYGDIPFGKIKDSQEKNDIPIEILNHVQKRVDNIKNETNVIVNPVEQNIMAQKEEKKEEHQEISDTQKNKDNDNQDIKPKKRRL